MPRWKTASVAAGAVLLFAAMKILPWGFGFVGGKYLYEAVAGRQGDPVLLTTAQVSEQLQNRDFQIFKAIRQEFPSDYDAIVQKITTVARSGGSSEDVSNASRVSVADLRKKYAPLLLSAPERSATEALGAQLDMLNHVMANRSSATCDRYVRDGPSAIEAPDQAFMINLDRIGATLFHAFGAAKNSGLPATAASDEDWSMLASALAKAGATQEEMKAISEANPELAELCPILAKLYAAALSLQGEPGRHVKAALLYEIAKN